MREDTIQVHNERASRQIQTICADFVDDINMILAVKFEGSNGFTHEGNAQAMKTWIRNKK